METKKLDDFIRYLDETLRDRLIYTDHDQIVLFGEYFIKQIDGRFQVFRATDDRYFWFNSIKNATVWGILYKNNKLSEARRVHELDTLIASALVDVQIHRRHRNKGNVEQKIINNNKLQHDLQRQRRFQWELDKYITTAHWCQQKRFQK